MATVDSGQQTYAANTLRPADDGGKHSLTNYQEEVKVVKDGPPAVHAATLESLMQEQEADTTAVTVDEVAHNPHPQYHPTPTNHHMQEQVPLPPHGIPAQPNQHLPLQLVYLQPTPHGVNIIPIQASGQPSFTSYSPPGLKWGLSKCYSHKLESSLNTNSVGSIVMLMGIMTLAMVFYFDLLPQPSLAWKILS